MTLTRILPTVSSDESAPQLDYHDLVARGIHVPEFIEQGMQGDFSFDLPGDASFRSRVTPLSLSTAGKDVSLISGPPRHLRINSGALNGLPGPTVDGREMTYAGVFRYQVTPDNLRVLMGSATGTGAGGGEFAYINSSGNILLNVRGYANTVSLHYSALAGAGISQGDFIFVAVTSKLVSDTTTEHVIFIGSQNPISATGVGVKNISTMSKTIAVGNAYNDFSAGYFASSVDVGRFLSGRGGRDVSELEAMYKRAKIVASRRGMIIH